MDRVPAEAMAVELDADDAAARVPETEEPEPAKVFEAVTFDKAQVTRVPGVSPAEYICALVQARLLRAVLSTMSAFHVFMRECGRALLKGCLQENSRAS